MSKTTPQILGHDLTEGKQLPGSSNKMLVLSTKAYRQILADNGIPRELQDRIDDVTNKIMDAAYDVATEQVCETLNDAAVRVDGTGATKMMYQVCATTESPEVKRDPESGNLLRTGKIKTTHGKAKMRAICSLPGRLKSEKDGKSKIQEMQEKVQAAVEAKQKSGSSKLVAA